MKKVIDRYMELISQGGKYFEEISILESKLNNIWERCKEEANDLVISEQADKLKRLKDEVGFTPEESKAYFNHWLKKVFSEKCDRCAKQFIRMGGKYFEEYKKWGEDLAAVKKRALSEASEECGPKNPLMNKLLPWLNFDPENLLDLEWADELDTPEKPGVYIMLSKGTKYIYPEGEASVYYIGESHDRSLRERLWHEHRDIFLNIRDNPENSPIYSRYGYAAAHGCKICWKVCPDRQSAKDLEKELLIEFNKFYRAFPVGNVKGAWE